MYSVRRKLERSAGKSTQTNPGLSGKLWLTIGKDRRIIWIDKHRMPAHRMGRLWKFKKDEIDEWVKAGGASSHDQRTE